MKLLAAYAYFCFCFLVELDKLIPKFLWKCKGPRRLRHSWRRKITWQGCLFTYLVFLYLKNQVLKKAYICFREKLNRIINLYLKFRYLSGITNKSLCFLCHFWNLTSFKTSEYLKLYISRIGLLVILPKPKSASLLFTLSFHTTCWPTCIFCHLYF